MRFAAAVLFTAVFIVMAVDTVRVPLVRPVWDSGRLLQNSWFVVIMLPGIFAMAAYTLVQPARLERDCPLYNLRIPRAVPSLRP